ncbi:MAG: GtrA family protein [Pseudomonadota bacterium]
MRFTVVGTVGFVVDGGLLWALMQSGWAPVAARAVSFPVAVVVTWALHRVWTFSNADKAKPRRQLGLYVALQCLGALSNLAVFLLVLAAVPPTALNTFAAFALGSGVGLLVNYAGSKWLVFKEPPAPNDPHP